MKSITKFFPIFDHQPELIFLDSAASVQKPKPILDAVQKFSEESYANIHRGNYALSLKSTEAVEKARKNISKFLGAQHSKLAFTKNGTEASNIFANFFSKNFLKKGDEIIIPISEHHANIVPWMQSCKETGAVIRWVYPEKNSQTFVLNDFAEKISEKTKLIVCAHVSNVTGQIFPIAEISQLRKKSQKKIFFIVDACQSVPHIPFNFEQFESDAAFFTGHKIGAGSSGGLILSQKFLEENEEQVSPLLWGGNIVADVTETGFTLRKFPERAEAGTIGIEQTIGLSSAVDFLQLPDYCNGINAVAEHGKKIMKYALEKFLDLPQWKILGPTDANQRIGNISFYHPHIHHVDIGSYLSEKNIAVRTGFHCANPLHHWLKISGTVRASFWVYTTKNDIDALIKTLQEIEEIFG